MRESTVRTDRLFAAADMLLAAMNSRDGLRTMIEVAPERRTERSDGLFTQAELVEAMAMLIRLGMAEGCRVLE